MKRLIATITLFFLIAIYKFLLICSGWILGVYLHLLHWYLYRRC